MLTTSSGRNLFYSFVIDFALIICAKNNWLLYFSFNLVLAWSSVRISPFRNNWGLDRFGGRGAPNKGARPKGHWPKRHWPKRHQDQRGTAKGAPQKGHQTKGALPKGHHPKGHRQRGTAKGAPPKGHCQRGTAKGAPKKGHQEQKGHHLKGIILE